MRVNVKVNERSFSHGGTVLTGPRATSPVELKHVKREYVKRDNVKDALVGKCKTISVIK